jgi:hypothetical protein
VNIYSSLSQPDRIAPLFNFDGDEEALAHLQPQPEPEAEVVAKPPRGEDESGEEEEIPEPEPVDDDEDEENKNKKKVKEPPVAPVLIGRPEPSDRDTMIELRTKALIPTSSTILAVSCFKSKQVLIMLVDIKTRSKSIRSKIVNQHSPTFLYQIDEDHLLVGTLNGKFEIWNIDSDQEEPTLKQVFDAHPGSNAGVSQILKLVDPSPMIIGDKGADGFQYLVSSAADKPEILIWKL